MPWESPLQSIATSIGGPVAKWIGVSCIVLSGLGIATIQENTATHSYIVNPRRILMIVCGLSMAFTAASFFLGFFGYSE